MQCYKTKHFLIILFLSISASQAWPLLTEVDLAKLSSLTETKRAPRTSKRSVRLIRAWWVPCHVLGSNTASNCFQLCSNSTRWVRSTSLCLCSLTLSSAVDKSQQHQVFRRKTWSEICWDSWESNLRQLGENREHFQGAIPPPTFSYTLFIGNADANVASPLMSRFYFSP